MKLIKKLIVYIIAIQMFMFTISIQAKELESKSVMLSAISKSLESVGAKIVDSDGDEISIKELFKGKLKEIRTVSTTEEGIKFGLKVKTGNTTDQRST